MAPHAISLGQNDNSVLPVLPSRASVISIDSILPDTRKGSLKATETEAQAFADAAAFITAAAKRAKQEADVLAALAVAEASAAEARKEEERKRLEKEREMSMIRAMQREDQVAMQRVADKARRETSRALLAKATATSPRHSAWGLFSKFTQAAEAAPAIVPRAPEDEPSPSSKSTVPHGPDASSGKDSIFPSTEPSPLRTAGGSGSSTQRPPISNTSSRGPASSLSTASATATTWSTSNLSPATLLSQELNSSLSKRKQEAPRTTEYRAGTPISPLVLENSEGRTPASTYPGADDSFLRHEKYFFSDGNITFLVDDTLYCIHRYFFSRDSEYFSTRFAQLGIRDHEALPTVVSLGDIERRDFEAFLSVIYPEKFGKHDLCYREWLSVLQLSTRWGFASLRKLALESINPPTPHDQLLLARRYSIGNWVLPALSALCERTAPLSLDEARQMNIEDVVIVATVRENIRNSTLRVDAAEIPRRVEAAHAGRLSPLWRVDVPLARPGTPPFGGVSIPLACTQTSRFGGFYVPSADPRSAIAEQGPDPTMGATASPNAAGVVNAKTIMAAPRVDPELAAREDDAVQMAKEGAPGEIGMQTVEQPRVMQNILNVPLAGGAPSCILCGDKQECIFCRAKGGVMDEEIAVERAAEDMEVGRTTKEALEPEAKATEGETAGGSEHSSDDEWAWSIPKKSKSKKMKRVK